ncbi:PAS domain-containing protein [Salinibacillus xinjiangensis]|uniref:histidine kinase n=1 Tax=Salinibacillus xinjiangensis TaxID=1229268 RepID=A0A6G1X4B6_9BACI|nr:PAS domain-containing protein [Salinibacillus xinjiangensis]MRG85804.1 PAS domain S-box protein [Salinibacillus xinjiangensis]
MEFLSLSSNPLLLFLAIVLTFMATYTALDLFLLIKGSERNKMFLFLGAITSMGIGIWVINFLMMLSLNTDSLREYNLPLEILSIAIGVSFIGIAFYHIIGKALKVYSLYVSSFFMTMAVFCFHVLGVFSLNYNPSYNPFLLLIALGVIYFAFFLSFWILFSKNFSYSSQGWLRPLSTLIITAAIVEGYFLFTKASSFYDGSNNGVQGSTGQDSFLFYLAIFISMLILVGLVITSTLVGKRLETSNSNLEDITSALDASSIVAITDPRGTITYVNDKFVEISKYNEEELIGKNHRILNSGFHSREFFKDLWRTIGTGHVWKGEIRNRAKDGSIYWVNTTIVPFMNKKGKPYQYVSIRTDITNRKLAEDNLKNSLKEVSDFKFALDQSSIVAMTDQRGRITYVNDKFCEISKYSRDELMGQDHRILNSGYHSKEFFKELWRTIGTGNVWKEEIRNKAKDDSYYWVNTTIVPFLNDNGKPYQYVAIRTDITDKKRTEEYMHRQDKLAAVGQLAAGVAHEIRNPLTSMKGYTEFLTMDEEDEERKEYLEIILDEIDRVDDIVEDFMVLAKPKDLTMEVKDIVSVMNNVLSLLDYDARKQGVAVHLRSEEEVMKAIVDENRIKQVFLNFVKNAIEAMPNGGDLTISLDYSNQKYIHVSITDTGVGIPEEKLKRIGEPFYTTKEKGNGLGLMISFKIVENHNGRVYVESELGKGTTFNVLIPSKRYSG